MSYHCCLGSIPDQDEELFQALLKMHHSAREKDLEYHVTTAGCHVDDLVFEMNGTNLINTASQGQRMVLWHLN